ncbi:MAG TPA: hypothetical protein VFH31_11935, partial [Pyrinomonadaceae bacterium]|nr:hypothetical protein [Pyrinomonadaceae bacterium]
MKPLSVVLLFVSCIVVAPLFSTHAAKDAWMSVRSKNYHLVGNASERDIRSIAEQLELFREVFVREFAGSELNSPIPTTVIVFKSDSSYRPYKPIFRGHPADIAGHFLYGSDVNYRALTTERRVDHPYAM